METSLSIFPIHSCTLNRFKNSRFHFIDKIILSFANIYNFFQYHCPLQLNSVEIQLLDFAKSKILNKTKMNILKLIFIT